MLLEFSSKGKLCKSCKSDYDKQRRDGPKRITVLATHKAYYKKNRGIRLKKERLRRINNKDKLLIYKRQYYSIPKNKEHKAQYDKDRYRRKILNKGLAMGKKRMPTVTAYFEILL